MLAGWKRSINTLKAVSTITCLLFFYRKTFSLSPTLSNLVTASSHYQKAGVRYILDSVIKELQKDEKRRYQPKSIKHFTHFQLMKLLMTTSQVHLRRNGVLLAVVTRKSFIRKERNLIWNFERKGGKSRLRRSRLLCESSLMEAVSNSSTVVGAWTTKPVLTTMT